MTEIILASKSPRRRELLSLADIPFEAVDIDVDETVKENISPDYAVQFLAERKADAAYKLYPGRLVLGADTIVYCNGRILGKPGNAENACEMLRFLSGKTHTVCTGVCLTNGIEKRVFCEQTDVSFYDLTEDEISAYVITGEPLDKAGAYGIQGKGVVLVRKIHGDYSNVVGLPVARLSRELKYFER